MSSSATLITQKLQTVKFGARIFFDLSIVSDSSITVFNKAEILIQDKAKYTITFTILSSSGGTFAINVFNGVTPGVMKFETLTVAPNELKTHSFTIDNVYTQMGLINFDPARSNTVAVDFANWSVHKN